MANMSMIEAAAAALFVSPRTLRGWVAAGAPHGRVGEGRRAPLTFDVDAVRAWASANGYTGQRGRPPAEVSLFREAAKAKAPPPAAEPSRAELRRLVALANARINAMRRAGSRALS